MRLYTKAGDLAFKTLMFPDGQPHFKLETYDRDFDAVTLEARIASPSDLFMVLMVASVLRNHGYSQINLDIPFLMGARMDRAIDWAQPFTLELVARLLNGAGLTRIRILDVHSDRAIKLIRNSENVLPYATVGQVWETTGKPIVICPDKGAVDRVNKLAPGYDKIYCEKTRDMATGKLSGFKVKDAFYLREWGRTQDCLIIDDICDAGGTFSGLAMELRKAGAKRVCVYVTHGIFSKGIPLDGIDHIYTTNSFPHPNVEGLGEVTTIPISMEKL